jgi:hypothetical protein
LIDLSKGTIIISRHEVTNEEIQDDCEINENEIKINNCNNQENKPSYSSIVKNEINSQINYNNTKKKKISKNSNNYSIEFKEIYRLKVPFSICGLSYGNLLGNFQNSIDLPVRVDRCENSKRHDEEVNESFRDEIDDCNVIVNEIINHLIDCIYKNNNNDNSNSKDNDNDLNLAVKLNKIIIDFDNNNKYLNYTSKQLIVATNKSIHVFTSEASNNENLSLKAANIDKIFEDI